MGDNKAADEALLAACGYTADDAWHVGVASIVEATVVSGKWRGPIADLVAYLDRRRVELESRRRA